MNNINCNIIEKENNKLNNYKINIDSNNYEMDSNEIDNNEIIAQQINYDLNFPLKYINNIMDYYEIKKSKLNKKQMIQKIVEYESNPENYFSVFERKRLFDNYIELKNNKFFSKFIIRQF